jgi:hypothetical protein
MKFWTTGRIDEQISFEIFQPVMLKAEKAINDEISQVDFGDLISSYDIVINIFKENAEEKFKYNPRTKETEIDVYIDHDTFLNSDFQERYLLYIGAILNSIDKMRNNKKLASFNFDLFYAKVSSLRDDHNLQ